MKVKDAIRTIAESIFRWVPSPTETGLRAFGNPDEEDPVFLTCNYDLTVRRVSKYLKQLDCYLLVAQSKGINVWCASCGGEFNEFSVISAIKTSGIDEKIRHRVLIAPQLSAPGIDVKKVREETGWNIRFGPVYAKDIPEYVRNDFKKTKEMRLVKFNLMDRLEMATIYFVTMSLIFSIPFLILFPKIYLSLILLTGFMTYSMYITFSYFPVKSGFVKVALSEICFLIAIIAFSTLVTGNPLGQSHLIIMSIVISAIIGMDFNGTTPIYKSDLGELFFRHGHKKMPFLTGVYRLNPYGDIHMNGEKCSGCGICYEVCPRDVYEIDLDHQKAVFIHSESCVNCGACVHQCPERCLEIV